MFATVLAAQRRTGPSRSEPAALRAHVRLVCTAGLLALASLVGCTSMAPQDDLAAEVTRYYAAHASEEDGRCTSPEIASVTKRKVLGSSGEVTHVRVRYSYFDASAPGATDWTRVLRAPRACTGVAERDFTLVATDLGYRVMQMSGPVRGVP
jgi:hypothetical protein